jgi:hypothetical protein
VQQVGREGAQADEPGLATSGLASVDEAHLWNQRPIELV